MVPSAEPRTPFEVGLESWSCAVCGADDARPYRPRMYAIGEVRFDLVRCRRCGLVYTDPRPDGPTLGRMYDDPEYYTHGYNLGVEHENYFDRRDELLVENDLLWERIEGELPSRGRAFELGAAGGFFLEAGRLRGWQVAGVELSHPAATYAREEMGLDVFEGLLADAPYPQRSFDLAVADNVLEHTTDPRVTLVELTRLVRPGGHVLLVVPGYVNSWIFRATLAVQRLLPRRLLGEALLRMLKMDEDHDGGYPYHILEFDRSTLLRLVADAGLEVVRVDGDVPFPASLFKVERPTLVQRGLRLVFRAFDLGMGLGLLPGARLRVLARVPAGAR